MWRARHEAYGNALVNENPDGDSTNVTFNFRFPGQYYDAESALHYNRFRYYDTTMGRYISADPIGQAGGLNLYVYAVGNPAQLADYLGLAAVPGVPSLGTFLTGAGGAVGEYMSDFWGGLDDLARGRRDMMDAGTIGADGYFHCRANCEASKRGQGGYDAARMGSRIREELQNEPSDQRQADEDANQQGQCAGKDNPDADCYEECADRIPPSGIPPRHLPPHASPDHML